MTVTDPMLLVALQFASANPVIRIHPDSGGVGSAQDVTLTAAVDTDYWMSGDGQTAADVGDLVEALETALNTNTDGVTFTVTISSRNVLTITADLASDILWSHVNTTVDPTLFGWTTADVTGFTSTTAPNQAKGCWFASNSSSFSDIRPFQNAARDRPRVVAAQTIAISGASRSYLLAGQSADPDERTLEWSVIREPKVYTAQAHATEPYGALQYFLLELGALEGRPIRVYDDGTSRTSGSYGLYRLITQDWNAYVRRLSGERLIFYDVTLPLIEVRS